MIYLFDNCFTQTACIKGINDNLLFNWHHQYLKGIHPQNHQAGYSGVLQADAYGGYRTLYKSGRITEALQRIGELSVITSVAVQQNSVW